MEAELPVAGHVAEVVEIAVDVEEPRARLVAARARPEPHQAVEAGEVEDDAAGERYGLTVVAGATAPHRQRHAVAGAGGGDADHLVAGSRQHGEVGPLVLELRLEDRREPEEVPALLPKRAGIVGDGDAGEVGPEGVEGGPVHDRHSRAVSKACTSLQSATKAAA